VPQQKTLNTSKYQPVLQWLIPASSPSFCGFHYTLSVGAKLLLGDSPTDLREVIIYFNILGA